MNKMAPSERNSASALNYLVISVSQAIAAAAAGASFTRFGYPAVLSVTAIVALGAAALSKLLLGGDSPQSTTVISTAIESESAERSTQFVAPQSGHLQGDSVQESRIVDQISLP
jgi:hypothetical protein